MSISISETAILSRVFKPSQGDLPPAAAEALLQLDFDPSDLARMHELAEKNQAGELIDTEFAELENYRSVGRLLDIVRSKARLSIRSSQT